MGPRIKTALAVVILSGLIWVFAEREVLKTTKVEVEIYLNTPREDVLVQYLVDDQPTSAIAQRVKLEVEGPAGRIKDIDAGKLKPRTVLLDVQELGFTETEETGPFTVRVVDLLNDKVSFEDSDTSLTVTEANPEVLFVKLTKLVRTPLEIKVYDEQDNELTPEILQPEQDWAFLPAGSTAQAKVILTASQQQQAMSELITTVAKVPQQGQSSEIKVEVKLLKGASVRPVDTIPQQRIGIGYVKPPSMEGKFEVVIEDLDQVRRAYGPIEFRGTREARTAYLEAKNHLLLVVREEDITSPSPARPLRYLLPENHPGLEIVNKKRDAVRFKIVKVNSGE